MQTYTYSEARQRFASVLDVADSKGKVLIRRKDGRTFAIVPERATTSPLDVPSISAEVSTEDLVAIVKTERSRTRGGRLRR